jgi:hypothetical protein
VKILIQIAFESDDGKTEWIKDSISLARGTFWAEGIARALAEAKGIPARIRQAIATRQAPTPVLTDSSQRSTALNDAHARPAATSRSMGGESLPFSLSSNGQPAGCQKSCSGRCTARTIPARITQFGERAIFNGQIARLFGERIWLFLKQSMRPGSAIQIETEDALLFCEIQRCESNGSRLPLEYLAEAVIVHSISLFRLDELQASFWGIQTPVNGAQRG